MLICHPTRDRIEYFNTSKRLEGGTTGMHIYRTELASEPDNWQEYRCRNSMPAKLNIQEIRAKAVEIKYVENGCDQMNGGSTEPSVRLPLA